MALMAICTGSAGNALANLLGSAFEQVKMAVCLRQAVSGMETRVKQLEDVRDDINVDLDQDVKKPRIVVKTWLEKVDSVIERSISILKESEQSCPNFFCRHRINRRIKDLLRDVEKLEKMNVDLRGSTGYGENIPRKQISNSFGEIPECGFIGSNISCAQSRLEEWLTNTNSSIKVIVVHGMGGVGKTTLLQAINTSSLVKESFDVIICETVSKDCHFLGLQRRIAKRLQLIRFPDEVDLLGDSLRRYLADKKYLLILDDMWEKLELSGLGVSPDNKSSKILITTRKKRLCNDMNADKELKMDTLADDEGWELFRSLAFSKNKGAVPKEIEDIAEKIAKECKGLPLAIKVTAGAVKHYDYQDFRCWDTTLIRIQKIDETYHEIYGKGDDSSLMRRLRLSYDDLPNDLLKTCFLYFAAYPEDENITCQDLTEMWIAEGFVKRCEEIYFPDIGHPHISDLCDRCLVEVMERNIDGSIAEVKIHDVLRDLAIVIARENRCIFEAGQSVKGFPKMERGCLRMSLMDASVRSLPATFACSSILVLILRSCRNIKEVPAMFLQQMPHLRVLDLCCTRITSLPPCIGDLKDLTSLRLEGTNISELPESIGNLSNLLFLNVRYCKQLCCLPTSIGNLKCLVGLNILGCSKLSIIPRVISELVSLQRLVMSYSERLEFDAADDTVGVRRTHLCLKDLQSLCDLRELRVDVESTVEEGVFGNWYNIRVLVMDFRRANQVFLPGDMKAMKELEELILFRCDVEKMPSWISEFRKLSTLQLLGWEQLIELPIELYELPCLRRLDLGYCKMLKELNFGRRGLCFPKLELLFLYCLDSLESLVIEEGSESTNGGVLRDETLPMLKHFEVFCCWKLRRLPLGFDKLRCLEEITGHQEWWDAAIQWQVDEIKTSLQTKFRIYLDKEWGSE